MPSGPFLPFAQAQDVQLGVQDGDFVALIADKEVARISASGQASGAFGVGALNVQLYGAKLDGATDDSGALVRAIAAVSANGGGTVYIPAGKTLDCGGATISIPAKVRLAGEPGAMIQRVQLVANGSMGAEVNITSAVAAGATVIPVANSASFSAGGWVRVTSCINSQSPDAGDFQLGDLTADNSYLAEYAQVLSVDSGVQITLTGPLLFPYANAAGPDSGTRTVSTIRPVTFVDGIRIDGLTVKSNALQDTISFNIARNFLIRNCTLDSSAATGSTRRPFVAGYCMDGSVEDSELLGFNGSSANYNTFRVEGSTNVWGRNLRISGGYQGFDFSYNNIDTTYWGGPSIGGGVEKCRIWNMLTDGGTNHYGCIGQTFRDLIIKKGTNNYGIRVRSPGTTVENCTITGSTSSGSGIIFQGFALLGGRALHNRVYGCSGGISVEPQVNSAPPSDGLTQVSIHDNYLQDCIHGIWLISPSTATARWHGISIRRNRVMNSTSDPIYVSAYNNGVTVEDNFIYGVPSGKGGIRFEANVAELRIDRNTVKNVTGAAVKGPGGTTLLTDGATFTTGESQARLYVGTVFTDAAVQTTTMPSSPLTAVGGYYRPALSRREKLAKATGLIAENYPREAAQTTTVMTTQVTYYQGIYLFDGEKVTNILLRQSGAASVQPTNFFVGLYKADGTLVSGSPDYASTISTTAGLRSLALTTPYTVPPGGEGLYYTAMLCVMAAGTLPGFLRSTATAWSLIGSNPYLYAQDNAVGSTLPSPAVFASGANAFWTAVT
jgi:hypothetical protein